MATPSISFIILSAFLATAVRGNDDFAPCRNVIAQFKGAQCLEVPSKLVSPNFTSFAVRRGKEELLLLIYEIDSLKNAGIFEREKQVMQQLEGESVLKVFEVHMTETHVYKLVEKVTMTLETFINTPGVQSTTDVLEMFLKLVRAVAFLNRNHIIHGGLSPASIFLTENNTIKIGEFRDWMIEGEQGYVVLMTPYTEPQFVVDRKSPKKFTSATDVYALGVILFRMSQKGRYPFDRTHPIELSILYSIGNFEVDEGTDIWIIYFLSICMSDQPSSRPSFEQLAELIQSYLQIETTNPVPYPFTVSSKANIPFWIREAVWDDINKAKEAFQTALSQVDLAKAKGPKSVIQKIFHDFKEFLPDPAKYFRRRASDQSGSAQDNPYRWVYALLLLLVLVLGFLFGRYLHKEAERKRTVADLDHQIQTIEENNI